MNELLPGWHLLLQDGDVTVWPDFLTSAFAERALEQLCRSAPWSQHFVSFHGRRTKLPRLHRWYWPDPSDAEHANLQNAAEWTMPLQHVQEQLEGVTQAKFNRVLLTLYRDGNDGISWHNDATAELDDEPIIATVSLGATRTFMMRHRVNRELREEIALSSGSLLVMRGQTQRYWDHQIPKDPSVDSPRISLTFLLMKTSMTKNTRTA